MAKMKFNPLEGAFDLVGSGGSYTFDNGLTEEGGTVKLGGEVEDGTALTLGNSGLTFHEVDLEPITGEAGAGYGASLEAELDIPGLKVKSGLGTITEFAGFKIPLADIHATYVGEDDTETVVTTGPLVTAVGVGSSLQDTSGALQATEQLTANLWSVTILDNRGEDEKGLLIAGAPNMGFQFGYGNHGLWFQDGRIKGIGDGTDPDHAVNKSQLDTKVDKIPGKQLSDQNYTQDEKNKLAGIEAGSEVNKIDSIVQGTNITIDNTDPKNPVINASGQPYQFQNGLTEEDGTVKLGGNFTSGIHLDTTNSEFGVTGGPGIYLNVNPGGVEVGGPGGSISTSGSSIPFTSGGNTRFIVDSSGVRMGVGNFEMSNQQIKYMGEPTDPMDAATKLYVDTRVPQPPATGTYTLKSINGVVQWVED